MELCIEQGMPKLGANFDNDGVNFGIFSKHGHNITLIIYKNNTEKYIEYKLDKIKNKTGDIWHIKIKGIQDKTIYNWKIEDINRNVQIVTDPYTKSIIKSKDNKYRSVVVDDRDYNWEDDRPLKIPWKDTIIYEMHVRLFTKCQSSNVVNRGTFEGILEKIAHIKELGITTIELMPIYDFDFEKDVWGYNPNHFFALSRHYVKDVEIAQEVFKFKDFIKAVHKEGLEVILDVVYNHTGEGNKDGPTINLKAIDNSIYYMLSKDNPSIYLNYSGTGNTLSCNNTVVKNLILDSLRYWVVNMHVDGFRFDLASILGRDNNGNWLGEYSLLRDIANDPILSGTKLISESWDASLGYHLGQMPNGFMEWNDKYRDTIRKFLKGELNTIPDLATRIGGSQDIFDKKGPLASINFVTAHDGFTLWDLFSYNVKHNLENGENNRDGSDNNISYNHGIEGETTDENIINMRKKQVKNAITLLMISRGVPMIVMGDEFCKTQNGNNNPYCLDNNISWINWDNKEKHKDIYRYFKKIIKFRRDNNMLRQDNFISQDNDIILTWHGVLENKPDWGYHSRTLSFMIDDKNICKKIYVAINGYKEPLVFQIPSYENNIWYRIIDTSKPSPDDFLDNPVKLENNKEYEVRENSILILFAFYHK